MARTDCVCSGVPCAAVGGFAALRMRRPLYGGGRLVGVIQRQQGTGAPRHSLTCHCEATKWPWQSRSARLNHWKTFGENANRFTGTVSVKMYLTFLARVDIIKMWKPGRLPQHMCFWICEVYYSQINEPSVAADGSLFTISEPVDDLANQPDWKRKSTTEGRKE